MKKILLICSVFIFSVVWLTGCKTETKKEQEKNVNETGKIKETKQQKFFVSKNDREVLFLQWAEKDGQIKGQLQKTYLAENEMNITTKTENQSIEGFVDDSNIALTIDGKNVTGTVKKDGFNLLIPNSNQEIQTYVFQKSSIENYNKLIDSLQKTVISEEEKSKIGENIGILQGAVNKYYQSSMNMNKIYPTWKGDKETSILSVTKEKANQPTTGYVAQIDLNSQYYYDGDGRMSVNYEKYGTNGWLPDQLLPVTSEVYYGITYEGKVIALLTPPDKSPTDAEYGLNNGKTGNGGWFNLDAKVYTLIYPMTSPAHVIEMTLKDVLQK